jgi:hypothetical protein
MTDGGKHEVKLCERDIEEVISKDASYAIVVRHELRVGELLVPRIMAVIVRQGCNVDLVLSIIDDFYGVRTSLN